MKLGDDFVERNFARRRKLLHDGGALARANLSTFAGDDWIQVILAADGLLVVRLAIDRL